MASLLWMVEAAGLLVLLNHVPQSSRKQRVRQRSHVEEEQGYYRCAGAWVGLDSERVECHSGRG